MKIIKFKKLNLSKYELTLENSEKLILYEDTLIKYNFLYSKDIDISLINEIIEYNDFIECYEESIKYISKKMRSEKEIEEYLKNKGYNENICESCIKRLKDNNFINEDNYAKSYINDRFYLSKDGPYKIIRDLENLGIDSKIINKNIVNISDVEIEEKAKKYIEKKKNNNSKYSNSLMNKKIKDELINLGYDINIIEKYLINTCDLDILEKEYNKVYKRYSSKYKGIELTLKIKNYLYSKGYKIDDINNVIEKNILE